MVGRPTARLSPRVGAGSHGSGWVLLWRSSRTTIASPAVLLAKQVNRVPSASVWWMASVMVIPTEHDSHRPRFASQATNLWVPPPESVRISV